MAASAKQPSRSAPAATRKEPGARAPDGRRAAAEPQRAAPGLPGQPLTAAAVLGWQRTSGNRFVQQLLQSPAGAVAPVVQRFKDTKRDKANEVDLTSLTSLEIRQYIKQFHGQLPTNITTTDKKKDLKALEGQLKVALGDLETSFKGAKARYEAARKKVDDELANWLSLPGIARKMEKKELADHFDQQMGQFRQAHQEIIERVTAIEKRSISDIQPGSQFEGIDDREIVIKQYGLMVTELGQNRRRMQRVGLRMGLPSPDPQVIADWLKLEDWKMAARYTRKDVDAIILQFAPQVAGLVDKGILSYRGSLARGVKSPKKFAQAAQAAQGPRVVRFDEQFQEADSRRGTVSAPQAPNFDVDLNIAAPWNVLTRLGLKIGPLDKTPSQMPIYQHLDKLLAEVKEAFRKLNLQGLDVDGCKLFINSSDKTEDQLTQGTPYTEGMIASAGMPHLAAALPHAYSMELVNKIREYVAAQKTLHGRDGQHYVNPYGWEPYFLELYNHIRTKGPLATFMPEVQVQAEPGQKQLSEQTMTPMPEDDVPPAMRAPFDPLTQQEGGWAGFASEAHGPGDVVLDKVFRGTVVRDGPFVGSVYVDVGNGTWVLYTFGRSTPRPANGTILFVQVVEMPQSAKHKARVARL